MLRANFRKATLPLILLVVLISMSVAQAQDGDQGIVLAQETEHVVIEWPVPVTEVWGVGDVIGTADIPDMAYYYLEYIELTEELTIPETAPWIPVTPAVQQPVTGSSLATLDTTEVPDGVYALRLTVNTNDGQQYHDVVSPVRVDNERFERLFGETTNEEEESEEIEAPDDNTPRVTPAGVAVNVRRCDIAQNDRCPAIDSLERDTFAVVIGHNSANTWYQVRTPHGATGWVSRSVIVESGDFSGVGFVQPPQALPPQPQQPTLTNTAIPNGMSIEGGTATCGEPFNVLVNIGNIGNAQSQAGTLTVQDVNVRTGDVTHTSYGNFPVINAGQNFVVRVAVQTAVYYNEQHELRAFANGRQFTLSYTLQQGGCGVVDSPTQTPTGRRFNAGECTINIPEALPAYGSAGGSPTWTFTPGDYSAIQVQTVGGGRWYEVNFADAGIWIPFDGNISLSGNCNP